MQIYANLDDLVEAIKRDELPSRLLSPGGAAAVLGVTRNAVYELCRRGVLPSWRAERFIFVDAVAVEDRAAAVARARKRAAARARARARMIERARVNSEGDQYAVG
jgi:hypothetical protein